MDGPHHHTQRRHTGFVFPVNGQVTKVGVSFLSPAGYMVGMSETEQPPLHHETTYTKIDRDTRDRAKPGSPETLGQTTVLP